VNILYPNDDLENERDALFEQLQLPEFTSVKEEKRWIELAHLPSVKGG